MPGSNYDSAEAPGEQVHSGRPEVISGELLAKRGLTLAVAESCTGGLLGDLLTDVPGSSAYFLGGVVAYHDRLKTALLGVDPGVIRTYGAVSEQCALEMAQGVLRRTGAGCALAITGIAGPSGGTAEKPVGTVYVALVGPRVERVDRFDWGAGRKENKRRSAEAALFMLIGYLQSM